MTTVTTEPVAAAVDRGGIDYVQKAALGALALLHLAGPWLVPALAAYVPADEPARSLAQDAIWALAAALVPAQTALILAWLAMGPGAWYIRFPAALLFIPFIWWPQASGYENAGGQQFLVMFGAIAAIVIGLMRLNGWTVQEVVDDDNSALRLRFSLLSILGLTGAVAGLIVVGRLAVAPFGPNWLVAWLALSLSLLAVLLLWSILAPGGLWWRVPIALLLAFGLTFVGPALDETLRMNWPFLREVNNGGATSTVLIDWTNFRGPWWTVATWMTGYVTILAGTLYVLRECDFRLVTDVEAEEKKPEGAFGPGATMSPPAKPV